MWSQALARAPAGRIPKATTARGEAARAAGEIQLSADIANAAGALLQLLCRVHNIKLLLDPMVVENAVRRYETCWLPLVAEYAATRARSILAPPLDVAWIWLLHALDPTCYARDMQSIMSTAVMRWWPDQMVPMHRPAQAIADAKVQWEALHLYEPFDITQQVATKYHAMQSYLDRMQYVSKFKFDFQTASASMAAFMYQVAPPHYQEAWFLDRAAVRYCRFLHLHRLHGRTTLVPPPDIDLCWRAHQLFHVAYCSDSMSLFNAIWLRDDGQLSWKPGMLEFNFQLTEELYRAAYNKPMVADGTMFRGSAPPLWAATSESPRPAMVPCDRAHQAVATPSGLAAWNFDLVEESPDTIIPESWPDFPEEGALTVCTASRGGPLWQQMSVAMHNTDASFDEACVLVLDPEGTVLAQAQLVGSDQLPIRPMRQGRRGESPALSGEAGECAFTITTMERDWGVMIAANRHGDATRPIVGDEKKDAKAGGMHVRLFRVGGASQLAPIPSHRWTRTETDGAIQWELLHGGVKSQLLGKPKRVDHPCDLAVILGPQGLPQRVVCGQGQDPALALAISGVLALQRTILTLQSYRALLRTYRPKVDCNHHKLLDQSETFAAARARMAFPESRLSTPERPKPKGSRQIGTIRSEPGGTKPALVTAARRERLAAQEHQQYLQCYSSPVSGPESLDVQACLEMAKPRPVAVPLTNQSPIRTLGSSRMRSVSMQSSFGASLASAHAPSCAPEGHPTSEVYERSEDVVSGRRLQSTDQQMTPSEVGAAQEAALTDLQQLSSDSHRFQQVMEALRMGEGNEEFQQRFRHMATKATSNDRTSPGRAAEAVPNSHSGPSEASVKSNVSSVDAWAALSPHHIARRLSDECILHGGPSATDSKADIGAATPILLSTGESGDTALRKDASDIPSKRRSHSTNHSSNRSSSHDDRLLSSPLGRPTDGGTKEIFTSLYGSSCNDSNANGPNQPLQEVNTGWSANSSGSDSGGVLLEDSAADIRGRRVQARQQGHVHNSSLHTGSHDVHDSVTSDSADQSSSRHKHVIADVAAIQKPASNPQRHVVSQEVTSSAPEVSQVSQVIIETQSDAPDHFQGINNSSVPSALWRSEWRPVAAQSSTEELHFPSSEPTTPKAFSAEKAVSNSPSSIVWQRPMATSVSSSFIGAPPRLMSN